MFRINDRTQAFDLAHRHGQGSTKYEYVVETESVVCQVCRAHWRTIGEPFYTEDGHYGPDAPFLPLHPRVSGGTLSESDLESDNLPPEA